MRLVLAFLIIQKLVLLFNMILKSSEQFFPLLKTISVSLIMWVIIIILIPILTVYKKIIELILIAIHGEGFGGFMDQADSLYLLPNGSMDCVMNAILIIRSEKKKDLYKEMRTLIQEKIFNDPDSYVKLTSSRQSFSGYPYLLKYDCEVEDIVNIIDKPEGKRFDKDYIRGLTAALTRKELPKMNSLLWNILVSNTPLEEDDNVENKYYRYPIIVRLHHSASDGTSLISLFMRVFGEEYSQKYSEDLDKKIQKSRLQGKKTEHFSDVITKRLKSAINGLKFWLEFIFLAAGRVIETNFMKPSDVNALHGKQCGEKIVAWTTEKQKEYISLIKRIKKRIPNSTFSSVVATALLLSVSNYFVKNNLPIPEHIQVLMTILLNFIKTDPDKPIPLENKTTGLIFELPLQEHSENLTYFLRKVSKTMQEQTRQTDLILNRFFIGYAMGLIPLNVIPNTAFKLQTILLTNIPGGPQVKILDGCLVELLVPFAPNFHEIGVSFAILTYDDKFQLSLLADKALLHSHSEAQKIVDDVFTQIKLLDIESQSLFHRD